MAGGKLVKTDPNLMFCGWQGGQERFGLLEMSK